MSQSYDFASAARDQLTKAVTDLLGARRRAQQTALAVISSSDPSAAMATFFASARGEYLASRRDGRKSEATLQGKAWNTVKSAMAYHFDAKGYRASWPNWASGEGSCRIDTKADAREIAKGAKADRDARDAEQLAQFQSDRAAAELAELRGLTPAQLADRLTGLVRTWSDDATQQQTAIRLLTNAFKSGRKPRSQPASEVKAA